MLTSGIPQWRTGRIDAVAIFLHMALLQALPADLETKMKLFRWAMAGASAYVIYKYTIGKKAEGEEVFKSPANAEGDAPQPAAAKPKRTRRPKS